MEISTLTKQNINQNLIIIAVAQKLLEKYDKAIEYTGITSLPDQIVMHVMLLDEEAYEYGPFVRCVRQSLESINCEGIIHVKKNLIESTDETIFFDLIITNLSPGYMITDEKTLIEVNKTKQIVNSFLNENDFFNPRRTPIRKNPKNIGTQPY